VLLSDCSQIVAAARFSQVFLLYKRRKLLRARQAKVEERQELKTRMRKAGKKGSNLSAMALKRFQRVSVGSCCWGLGA
jgi:hypothetical protein